MKETNEKILEEIEAYLQNKMSKTETELFAQKIKTNSELKELVSLYDSVDVVLGKKQEKVVINERDKEEKQKIKQLLESEKYKNISENLKTINNQYQSEKQKVKGIKRYLYIVTSAAAILIMYFMLMQNYGNNNMVSYYNENANWEDFPSLLEKGYTQNEASKVETLYAEHKYKEVITFVTNHKNKEVNSLLYLGGAYFYQNEYNEAHKIFDEIIATNSIDKSKGYWYKTLIYLKQKDKEQAKKMLTIITKNPNNYNHKKAISLLKKLK